MIQTINIYTCGPTVYDWPTLGNMRTFIWGNAFRCIKELLGNKVHYAMNITDIDDKIINKMKQNNTNWKDFTQVLTNQIINLFYSINILRKDDLIPRSSDYINNMVDIINVLDNNKLCYDTNNEIICNVDLNNYFKYGSSSDTQYNNRKILNQAQKYKKEDYVLWKKTNEVCWDTKLGSGRPGWHLECAAMIKTIFDLQFPIINIGGKDLSFPHQENSFYILRNSCINTKINISKLSIGWLRLANNTIISKSSNNNIKSINHIKLTDWKFIKLYFLSSSSTKDQNCINFENIIMTGKKMYESLHQKINKLPDIIHHHNFLSDDVFKFDNFNVYFSLIYTKAIDKQTAQIIWLKCFE